MSLVTALFAGRPDRRLRGSESVRVERLEVRRALAADDGSDPWDGFVPPDDGQVDVDTVTDPGINVVFGLPPEEFIGVELMSSGCDPLLPPPEGAFVTQAITHYRNVVTGGSEVHNTGGWWSPSGNWVVYYPGGYNDASPDEGRSGADTEESSTTDLADWSRAFILEGPSQRPTDVVATRTADGILVTWNDPFANQGEGGTAIDGYVVEARRLRDASWTSVGTVTGATTLPVVGLDASAHYVFRVTKTNIGMTTMLSAPSLPSRPVTTGSAVGITAETTATGGARISWDAVAAGSGEQIVEYRRLAAADWVRVGEFPAAAGVATIDGLPGGRHYTFRILAAGGVYTPRTRAVTTPVDADYRLGAEASAAGTVLTWNDPQAATRTETVVEYRRLKDAGWAALGTVASSAGAISIDGLVPNANYVFRLRQRDASGFVSRTVATRAVTTAPDCVFPPACVDFPGPVPQGGSFLIVNPNSGSGFGTEIAGGGGTSTTGGAGSSTVSGTLIATGTIVPIDGITGTFVLGNAGGDDTAG